MQVAPKYPALQTVLFGTWSPSSEISIAHFVCSVLFVPEALDAGRVVPRVARRIELQGLRVSVRKVLRPVQMLLFEIMNLIAECLHFKLKRQRISFFFYFVEIEET